MLFSIFWWKHLGYTCLYWSNLVLGPFVILVLLSTRVHYCIDIVAAMIVTFWLETHVLVQYIGYFDSFWSHAFDFLRRVLVKSR